jgi:hypothetical protein
MSAAAYEEAFAAVHESARGTWLTSVFREGPLCAMSGHTMSGKLRLLPVKCLAQRTTQCAAQRQRNGA